MVNILRKIIRSVKGFFIIWPREVKEVMAPAVHLLEKNKYDEAGREIAEISLDICAKIEGNIMNPRRADLYYTYILDVDTIGVKIGIISINYFMHKNDFAKWVVDGLFMPLETVRALPNILSDVEAKKIFLKLKALLIEIITTK